MFEECKQQTVRNETKEMKYEAKCRAKYLLIFFDGTFFYFFRWFFELGQQSQK